MVTPESRMEVSIVDKDTVNCRVDFMTPARRGAPSR